MAKSSKGSNPDRPNPGEFTDRDIRLILRAFTPASEGKRALAPKILRDWAEVALPQYWAWERARSEFPERQRQASAILSAARRFLASLQELDNNMRTQIADRLALNAELIANEDRLRVRDRFETELEYLRDLITAIENISRPRRRGRPRNRVARRVILDLAAIFEYLTDTKATRQVDSVSHEESGPFQHFAAAVWPVIFGSDDGLAAALRNWDETRAKVYSPVVYEMDLRNPEWGLFD